MIPLSKAMFCVECEWVVETSGDCLHCGSKALLSLAQVLQERKTEDNQADGVKEVARLQELLGPDGCE